MTMLDFLFVFFFPVRLKPVKSPPSFVDPVELIEERLDEFFDELFGREVNSDILLLWKSFQKFKFWRGNKFVLLGAKHPCCVGPVL